MQNDRRGNKLNTMVLTAMMMCLILVSTYFFKIPTIATKGYVHLGDAAIYLAVMVLGKKNGAIAAGVGSCLSDLLGGYAYYAPWTLGTKLLMALVAGIFLDRAARKSAQNRSAQNKNDNRKDKKRRVLSAYEIFGMVLGGLVMVAGYALAAKVMYGTWAIAIASVPENVGQFVVGIVISVIIATALQHTPARQFFSSTSMTTHPAA